MATTKRTAAKRGTAKRPAAKRSAMKKSAPKKVAAKKRAAPKKATKRKVLAVPKGYHTATPYLIARGARAAMDFYNKAFGAKQTVCMEGPGGSIMHGEFRIGDSMFMISEENVGMGQKSPETLGGSGTHVMLYVKGVDDFVKRAADAGATIEMPPSDMFWGDRYAKLRDPFGHLWSIGTHVEDVTPKAMERRMAEWMKQMSGGGAG